MNIIEPFRPGVGLTGPLEGELLAPIYRTFRLVRPFRVRALGKIYEVPIGFETDFASVPRIFWRIIPPWGCWSPAAVVHDYLYAHNGCSRKKADQIFLDIMIQLEVPKWPRTLMYWAVRLFGWRPWNQYRKDAQNADH